MKPPLLCLIMPNSIEEIATLSCSNCGSLLLGEPHVTIEYPHCDLCAKDKELHEHQKFDDERLKQLDL